MTVKELITANDINGSFQLVVSERNPRSCMFYHELSSITEVIIENYGDEEVSCWWAETEYDDDLVTIFIEIADPTNR